MKQKLNYKMMVEDIDRIIDRNHEFLFEMECRQLPDAKKYTQKEAGEMSHILGCIYLISHCLTCEACQRKFIAKSS